ncbi:MAG: adenylate/guanylate cyclase domain-containing protein [Alphaproteobacteria bacterium]|nr:adenylate/guanylate cyclase domain-containing protein [Alphaproteobacteria bacterium]
MEETGVKRKLAVILAADFAGYSRLMGADEEATLKTLGAYREVIDATIAGHDGRIFATAGDSVVAEFASPVEAVRAAISIQEELSVRNAGLADERKMLLRIGINLGDVMVQRDNLLGDGVNVAARLEGLAEPGGICLSDMVYQSVEAKLDLAFEDLGAQSVKNIAKPVRAWRIVPGSAASAASSRPPPRSQVLPRLGVLAFAAIAVAVLAITGAAIWNTYLPGPAPPNEGASETGMALPLPDKPSIAVLPFTNMSADPEQGYFSDGITDDLITDLAKISGLFVIARNSVFTYKGRAVKVQKVASDLGVRYVLEGSVRKAGGRVRINAQLVDATTGRHLWAERYDREYKEIFALQDEVIGKIVSALAVELTDSEKAGRAARKERANLQAHETFLRAKQYLWRFTTKDTAKAKELFEKAIALNPNHARAHAALGRLHYNEWEIWGKARDRNLARALELGRKAAALDDSLAGAHLLLTQVYRFRRQFEQSEIETDKALALDPTDADTLAGLGDVLRWSGRAPEAIGLLQKAMRLDPFYPAWNEFYLGHAYFLTGRYEEAIEALKRGAKRNSNYPAFPLYMAASYAMLGRTEDARAAAAEVLRINPNFTLQAFVAHVPYRNRADVERDLAAMRKAGLPETSKAAAP